jgi:hypothetical protein
VGCPTASSVEIAWVNLATRESVQWERIARESNGQYGHIFTSKPDNVICFMYENFSSLSLFAMSPMHHKKIHQLNMLMSYYGVDFLARCETRTDWRFFIDKNDRFCNLFGSGLQS